MLWPTITVSSSGELSLAPDGEREGIDLAMRLGVLGHVDLHLESPLEVSSMSADVRRLLRDRTCWVGPFDLCAEQEATIVDWLDKGAHGVFLRTERIVVTTAQAKEILAHLPRARVALCVDWEAPKAAGSLDAAIRRAMTPLAAVGVPLHRSFGGMRAALPADPTSRPSDAAQLLEQLKAELTAHRVRAWLSFGGEPPLVGDVGVLHKMDVSACAAVPLLPDTGPILATKPASVASALIACARTDRSDGLFTTVVVDEAGVCLGLVYSSAESVVESVRTGRGVYYSRSRDSLWRKGDTSGAWQELHRAELDCDSDALRYTVRQHGDPPSFCHLGVRTCWGPSAGLAHLQLTLEARRRAAPAGSYTKKLFDDPHFLRAKLLEEAQELVEAQDPDDVAAEAADVCYFMMVRCVAAGVGLGDIEKYLDQRSLKVKRRPGLAKPERVKAAERSLAKSGAASRAGALFGGDSARAAVIVAAGAASLALVSALAGIGRRS